MAGTSEEAPSPGDVSLCFNCGNIQIFNEDMTRRPATPGELEVLESDERIIKVQKLIRYMFKKTPSMFRWN